MAQGPQRSLTPGEFPPKAGAWHAGPGFDAPASQAGARYRRSTGTSPAHRQHIAGPPALRRGRALAIGAGISHHAVVTIHSVLLQAHAQRCKNPLTQHSTTGPIETCSGSSGPVIGGSGPHDQS